MTRARAEPRAIVVADLGFGDSGKGLVVDALARRLEARLVVRFNGGAQAGHNVVTPDGRHHTFSQFGAATFVPGVRTFLSRRMVVHPTALLVEAERLARAGANDAFERLSISREALVTTPFHQAAGRLRELARGGARHGSCGVGVGETVSDSLSDPDAPRVKDLLDPRALRSKLSALQARKRAELDELLRALKPDAGGEPERRALEDSAVVERWLEAAAPFRAGIAIVDDGELSRLLNGDASVIFEGAQGVLLDETHGFHPYTTWSNCTFDNALESLATHGWSRPIERLGVLRSYLVRHGPGPFPTEDADAASGRPEPHNQRGPWQGDFRAGWPDWVLADYALAACRGADALALTHMDAVEERGRWRAAVAYGAGSVPPAAPGLGFAQRARVAESLFDTRPIYREWSSIPAATAAASYVRAVEERFSIPVALTSTGPSANAVTFR